MREGEWLHNSQLTDAGYDEETATAATIEMLNA